MKKVLIALSIALAASSSAFAQGNDLKGVSVSEASAGAFTYVDYVVKDKISAKEETKILVAVRKEICSRPDLDLSVLTAYVKFNSGNKYTIDANPETCKG